MENTSIIGSRRLRFDLPKGGFVGVSAATGASRAEVAAEVLRVLERAAWGRTRRVYCIDGYRLGRESALRYAVGVAWSYVEMWRTIAWRATFARSRVKAEVQQLRATFSSPG